LDGYFGKARVKYFRYEDNSWKGPSFLVDSVTFDYLGQTPPGSIAIPFSTGNSGQPNRLENSGIFSRDGKEFYFSVISQDWKTRKTYVRKFINPNYALENKNGGEISLALENNPSIQILFLP
jgi:hypothetical protein